MKEIIDFSYREYGQDGLVNKKHSHGRFYEILQIWSGTGTVVVQNKLYPIKSGAVYFINGMDIHCSAPKKDEEYIRSKIVIACNFIDSIASVTECDAIIQDLFFNSGGLCIELSENGISLFDNEFLTIKDSLQQNSVYTKINIASSLFRLLTYAHSHKKANAQVITNKTSEVLRYINNNIGSRILLDDLCSHVHCSKYYLCRIFKEETKMTVFSYILSRRLSMARKLLIYTEAPLSEIALECGFSSFSYFSKAFRENEGITPSEFRQKNKHDINPFH